MASGPPARHSECVVGLGKRGICGVIAVVLTACPGRDAPESSGGDETDTEANSSGTASETDTDVDPDGSSEGPPPPEQCDEPGGYPWGGDPVIPGGCDSEITNCKEDMDRDGVSIDCDNAIEHHNPQQRDADGDLLGDPIDLCPVIAGEGDETADSDRDGVGSGCDTCRQSANAYNLLFEGSGAPDFMLVRNVSAQLDSDSDGIGDACDNCPTVANCGNFGPDDPAVVGSAVPWDDPASCQTDADANGIGDACEGMPGIGLTPADDFDGDGLNNGEDPCPRFAGETDDHDADGVGDVCDSCPFVANPMQVVDPDGDDEDGDFVGAACESDASCQNRADPRRIGFFDVAVGGSCCVSTFPGDGEVRDPDGVPLSAACAPGDEAAGTCRSLPDDIVAEPGVVAMPPGCELLLAEGCEAREVTLDDVGGDPIALWSYACFLPQWDEDFDGIGSSCDFCPFAFDPTNETYTDINGMEWPTNGRYCNGDYSVDNLDPANGCVP
jgi:hypothetical protein